MLQQALEFVKSTLNQSLKNRFGLTDDTVVLNGVINPNGEVPRLNENKIIISLLNIEPETNKPFNGRNQRLSNGSYVDVNPAQRYSLDVLLTSNFHDYSESLKFLNATLAFFQINSTVDHQKFSNMPEGIKRLDLDVEKITFHQMHSLWSAMGAKYQPSIIYKISLITIQSEELIRVLPSINSTDNTAVKK